jgi:iron(III) transport system ATP-binding protein|tara:strand:- start:640 stop:1689 length:1050 start_codon:yes stop_codon:yes gene_type:complete
LLEVRNISCNYELERAVFDLSLTVNRGEQVCLLGPSGCGKTTVLRAIAGFHPLLTGGIFINDQQVSAVGAMVPPEARRVGMVFQDHALFPHLSVRQNIASGLRQLSAHEQKTAVGDMLDRMGLSRHAEKYPHELSGGQQQRVALARALAPKPLLLLMDEPFSNLDQELREHMGQEVSDMLKESDITCVMVTHDQNDAFALGDQVGVMADGAIIQWDTPYNLYHQPRTHFVADFIGNGIFLPGTVSGTSRVVTSLGDLDSNADLELAADTLVEVLIRPDDVVHDPDGPIQATVRRRAFKGAEIMYTLRTAEDITLLALFPSHANFEIGDDVSARLAVDHLVVFQKEAEIT